MDHPDHLAILVRRIAEPADSMAGGLEVLVLRGAS